MSSRFKIPKEIKDPAILLNGNSAKIIKKADAEAKCDLRDGKKPSARRCGFQKVRSDRWAGTRELEVYKLTDFGHADLPPKRGLSSRMSPRHPQSEGDFRRGPYHDLLDGGNPEALATWGEQNRHYNGPRCETCKEPSVCYKLGKLLCRACAEKTELDPGLIQAIRDLSEERDNASAI